MTNNTNVTLDDVILNDGDIAAQTSESQIHSNITIDAATLRDKGPRKPFSRTRPTDRPDRGPRQSSAHQPAMPKVSSFLSHTTQC